MKRKCLIIILIPLLIFAMYQLIKVLDYKNLLSDLEKYTFVDNEVIIKELEYNNKKYAISRYYNNSSSWSHLNLRIMILIIF